MQTYVPVRIISKSFSKGEITISFGGSVLTKHMVREGSSWFILNPDPIVTEALRKAQTEHAEAMDEFVRTTNRASELQRKEAPSIEVEEAQSAASAANDRVAMSEYNLRVARENLRCRVDLGARTA